MSIFLLRKCQRFAIPITTNSVGTLVNNETNPMIIVCNHPQYKDLSNS